MNYNLNHSHVFHTIQYVLCHDQQWRHPSNSKPLSLMDSKKKNAILTEIGSQRQAKRLLAIHFLNYFKYVNNEESRKVLSNRSQELRGRNEHHWTAKRNMFWWANRMLEIGCDYPILYISNHVCLIHLHFYIVLYCIFFYISM